MIALALALVAAAPSTPAQVAPFVVKARADFDNEFNDYPHTRVRNMHAMLSSAGQPVAICGEVNTPNGSGGMSGWMPVALPLDQGVPLFAEPADPGYAMEIDNMALYCPMPGHAAPADKTLGTDDLSAVLAPSAG